MTNHTDESEKKIAVPSRDEARKSEGASPLAAKGTLHGQYDWQAIEAYVRQVHEAAAPLRGISSLRVSACLPKKSARSQFQHFRIGDTEGMVQAILAFEGSGKNISVPWLVISQAAPRGALKETDILAGLAIVTDPSDRQGDKYRLNELGV
jgi:hypothetical protein